MNIGNRIKQRRIELDLTVDDLVALTGKSRATIYRYENGDIENMPSTVLEPLAVALRTTPAYLMGWDNPAELVAPEPVRINTLAAHFEGEDFTEDEANEIMQFAEFVKSRRK